MAFQISALPYAPFAPFFSMDEAALATNACRLITVTANPGYPCVVSLADAEIGERLLVANYTHLPEASPFRSSNAVYVREDAVQADLAATEIPEMLRIRLLSLRSFDREHMLVAADVMEGEELADGLDKMLADEDAAYVHIHLARPGCYAARAVRI